MPIEPGQAPSIARSKRLVYWFWLILTLTACANIHLDLSPPAKALPTATISAPQPIVASRPNPGNTSLPTPVVLAIPVQQPCPLPDLRQGQFISASGSYSQTEPAVSGRMACRIERGSCAYERLVGLVDPSIVYKQEESPPFDEEDILMHPALIAPLARLNRLVQIEWGTTVQLRVTDAYDSQLDHDPPQTDPTQAYSLHYEGRAIDLTLSPIDRSQYGRLCALAHCAGFDWVLHEGTHCHASINAVSLCTQCGN